MEAKCPNCGKGIALAGAKELAEEFNIGANALQHARERGTFPAPWLSFGNRNIWLAEDINGYVSSRGRARVEKTVTELMNVIASLPGPEGAEARRLLEEKLGTK